MSANTVLCSYTNVLTLANVKEPVYYLAVVASNVWSWVACRCKVESFPSMKDPRVTVTFGGLVEPYYNSLTLHCYSLPDSGTKKSQEVKLNFTSSVVDLQIKWKCIMYAVIRSKDEPPGCFCINFRKECVVVNCQRNIPKLLDIIKPQFHFW